MDLEAQYRCDNQKRSQWFELYWEKILEYQNKRNELLRFEDFEKFGKHILVLVFLLFAGSAWRFAQITEVFSLFAMAALITAIAFLGIRNERNKALERLFTTESDLRGRNITISVSSSKLPINIKDLKIRIDRPN